MPPSEHPPCLFGALGRFGAGRSPERLFRRRSAGSFELQEPDAWAVRSMTSHILAQCSLSQVRICGDMDVLGAIFSVQVLWGGL